MDEMEVLAIEMNQTLVPKGYNVSVGGKSYISKPGPRKRLSGMGEDLPKYMTYYRKFHKGIWSEVVTVKCPTGRGSNFVSRHRTMEQKLADAIAWLAVDQQGVKMIRKRSSKNPKTLNLPPGIRDNSLGGFEVNVKGIATRKYFGKKNHGSRENAL